MLDVLSRHAVALILSFLRRPGAVCLVCRSLLASLNTVATLLYRSGRHRAAAGCYTSLIALPSLATEGYEVNALHLTYANRAACWLKLNRNTLAYNDCTTALSISANCEKALYRLAQSLEGLRRHVEAGCVYGYGALRFPEDVAWTKASQRHERDHPLQASFGSFDLPIPLVMDAMASGWPRKAPRDVVVDPEEEVEGDAATGGAGGGAAATGSVGSSSNIKNNNSNFPRSFLLSPPAVMVRYLQYPVLAVIGQRVPPALFQPDVKGRTLWHHLLLRQGAVVTPEDKMAVDLIVVLLTEAGCDPLQADRNGRTPSDIPRDPDYIVEAFNKVLKKTPHSSSSERGELDDALATENDPTRVSPR